MTLIRRAYIGFFMAALSMGACSSGPAGPERDLAPQRDASPVQTDALAYRLQRLPGEYRAYATASYRNDTGAPVYFARCVPGAAAPMFGVRRTGADSTRTLFLDWDWACVGGVPTGEVEPGGSLTVRVPLGSLDQPSANPPLRPEDIIGLLRVELALCARFAEESGDCEQLPQSQRQSNAFLVSY